MGKKEIRVYAAIAFLSVGISVMAGTPLLLSGAAMTALAAGWLLLEYFRTNRRAEEPMGKKFTLFKLGAGASVGEAIAKDIVVRNFEEVEGLSVGENATVGTASFERFSADGEEITNSDEITKGR